jgi:hypothetical protein
MGYTFKWGRSILFNFTAICNPNFDRSFYMVYMVENFCKSSFMYNKQCIFWTSELGVMTKLVEAVQAAWCCTIIAKGSTNAPPR